MKCRSGTPAELRRRSVVLVLSGAVAIAGAILLIVMAMRSDDDGDAGRSLEPLTSAREFAVQPAHEPEPIAPFASPFIDLLGCRIRQPMALKLQGPNLELAEPATVYEHQLVQFNWTIDEALARRANYFGLTVVSESAGSRQPVWQIVGIAGSERSVGYGRANQRREDAIERAALHLSPGTYLVTLAAWDGSRPPSAPGVPIAQTRAILQVGPMPDGFITFYDIKPDGSIRYAAVHQLISTSPQPLWRGSIYTPVNYRVERLVDDEGEPIAFQTEPTTVPVPPATTAPSTSPAATSRGPNRHQYRLRQPVSLGQPILTADVGTITDLLRPVSPGVFEYDVYHSPWNRKPTRRIDIFRLPRHATLLEKAPSDTKVENFQGQIQMCFDRLLEPGDAYRARFRYAMPPPTTQQ